MMDKYPKMGLGDVAEQCGFDSYPNFVRAFKSVRGETPSDYRKQYYT